MTSLEIPLKEALASLPPWAHPTVVALQQQGVEVTCWTERGQWALQGRLEWMVRQTEPAELLTRETVDELWHLMTPLIAQRNRTNARDRHR